MIIKQNKAHTFGGFITGLLFLALFLLVVIIDFRPILEESSDMVTIGVLKMLSIACIPFLLFAVIYFFMQMFSDKPLLEINDVALVDNSSGISLGTIYWRDIQNVYYKNMYLVIELKNPEEYLQKANFVQRLFMKINKKMGYDYVCITAERFKKRAPDFFKALSEKVVISFK